MTGNIILNVKDEIHSVDDAFGKIEALFTKSSNVIQSRVAGVTSNLQKYIHSITNTTMNETNKRKLLQESPDLLRSLDDDAKKLTMVNKSRYDDYIKYIEDHIVTKTKNAKNKFLKNMEKLFSSTTGGRRVRTRRRRRV